MFPIIIIIIIIIIIANTFNVVFWIFGRHQQWLAVFLFPSNMTKANLSRWYSLKGACRFLAFTVLCEHVLLAQTTDDFGFLPEFPFS